VADGKFDAAWLASTYGKRQGTVTDAFRVLDTVGWKAKVTHNEAWRSIISARRSWYVENLAGKWRNLCEQYTS
jgi:hypothetical protein